MTKCIRYSVDSALLNAGVPVERLNRKDEREFQSKETIEHLNRYAQGTQRLCGEKSVEHYPPIQLPYQTIELSLTDYSKVVSDKSIKISAEVAEHVGKKFKVIKKDTSFYVMRVLCMIGDACGGKLRGYFS